MLLQTRVRLTKKKLFGEGGEEEGREAAARLFLCQSLSLSFECEWRAPPRAAHKKPASTKGSASFFSGGFFN